jgi:hypothetical protein
MTTSVATDTDYDLSTATTVDEHEQGQKNLENNEKVEENNNNKQQQQQQEIVQGSTISPVHKDEHIQEDDVLVEENITPFYMNTGIGIK